MKYSEVLNRYVNTGSQIPEEQYDQLSPSLKKSYMRMRSISGYFGWEFKLLTDDEKIKYIEKKGDELDYNDVYSLLYYSEDKDLIVTKIIDVKGEKLTPYDVDTLLKFTTDNIALLKFTTDNIAVKIIQTKGNKLKNDDIYYLFQYSNDKDLITTKIIEVKGKELNSTDITYLLKYSEDKELIKKLLLQKGVYYKLINDMLLMFNIETPLIPDNYQEMLNEIRRIKQIMG